MARLLQIHSDGPGARTARGRLAKALMRLAGNCRVLRPRSFDGCTRYSGTRNLRRLNRPVGGRLLDIGKPPVSSMEECAFIVREHGSGTRAAMESFFAARRFELRITMEMSSNETIKQAVMAGTGHQPPAWPFFPSSSRLTSA